MNVYRMYFHEITLENLFVLLDHVKTFIQNKITRILKYKLWETSNNQFYLMMHNSKIYKLRNLKSIIQIFQNQNGVILLSNL